MDSACFFCPHLPLAKLKCGVLCILASGCYNSGPTSVTSDYDPQQQIARTTMENT